MMMPTRTSLLPEHTSLTPSEIGPDGFVAEVVLDAWQRRGRARRVGGVLWLDDQEVHDVVDAVRILGRRNGESDPYGWTGRVFPLRELLRLGAALGPDGCKLGSTSYDVEFGVLVEQQPVGEGDRLSHGGAGDAPRARPMTGPRLATRPLTNGTPAADGERGSDPPPARPARLSARPFSSGGRVD